MFKGNIKIKIEKLAGYDEYGQPVAAPAKVSRCSIVKLATERAKTTVRTDTSASGGNAHEIISDARILVNINADIAQGDKITVMGVTLRVDQLFRRNDVNGKPHHHQVDCSLWR